MPYNIGAIIAAANPPVKDREPPREFLAAMLSLPAGETVTWQAYDTMFGRDPWGECPPVLDWTTDDLDEDEDGPSWVGISVTRYANAWVVGWRNLQHAETTLTGAWRVRTAIMRDYASYASRAHRLSDALDDREYRETRDYLAAQERRLGLDDQSLTIVRSTELREGRS